MTKTDTATLRRYLSATLDKVVEHHETVTVTTKKGNVVILSERDYNAMMETIYLSSQPGLVAKIKEGDKEDPKKMASYENGLS